MLILDLVPGTCDLAPITAGNGRSTFYYKLSIPKRYLNWVLQYFASPSISRNNVGRAVSRAMGTLYGANLETTPFYLYRPEQNVRYSFEAVLRIRSLRLVNGCGLARTLAWCLSLGVVAVPLDFVEKRCFRTNCDSGRPGGYNRCALQISWEWRVCLPISPLP